MKEVVSTKHAAIPVSPISQAIRAGDLLFTSGQLGRAPETGELAAGIAPQARQALANLKAVVEAAGGNMADVVRVEAFVVDLDQVGEFNDVFKQFFPSQPPARACVEVSRLARGALIELTAVAYVPTGR